MALNPRGPFLVFSLLLVLALPLCLGKPQEPVQEEAVSVPDELGRLLLMSHKSGDAAIKELSIMHQGSESLTLVDGHIAIYSSGEGGEVMLWIGEAENEDIAQRLLEYMNAGMSSSRVFTKPQLRLISGQAVYFVTGMSMSNYYFVSGRNVIWVATKNPDQSYGDALVLQLMLGS